MSGEICHDEVRGCYWLNWVKASDTAQHPPVPWTLPPRMARPLVSHRGETMGLRVGTLNRHLFTLPGLPFRCGWKRRHPSVSAAHTWMLL